VTIITFGTADRHQPNGCNNYGHTYHSPVYQNK